MGRTKPPADRTYPKKFTILTTDDLHTAVRVQAAQERTSITELIERVLTAYLKSTKVKK